MSLARSTIGRFSDLKTIIGKVPESNEEIYLCPYCEDVTGKRDTKGKLYYNTKKNTGWCHKCETVILGEKTYSLSDSARLLLSKLESRKQKILRKSYSLKNWTTPVSENELVFDYLKIRKISEKEIRKFRLRACKDPYNAVVMPNKDLGDLNTDFFQLRSIENGRAKYNNPINSFKDIYGTSFLSNHETAILCEGIFSAISSSRIPNTESLCSYSKSITTLQLETLKGIKSVKRYYLMYDGGEFRSIVRNAKKLLKTGREVWVSLLPINKDPNDLDTNSLIDCYNLFSFKFSETDLSLITNKARTRNCSNFTSFWNSMRETVKLSNTKHLPTYSGIPELL